MATQGNPETTEGLLAEANIPVRDNLFTTGDAVEVA